MLNIKMNRMKKKGGWFYRSYNINVVVSKSSSLGWECSDPANMRRLVRMFTCYGREAEGL